MLARKIGLLTTTIYDKAVKQFIIYERGYVGLLAWVQYFRVYYVHAIYTGSVSPEIAVIKILQYSTDSSLTPCLTLQLRLTSVK